MGWSPLFEPMSTSPPPRDLSRHHHHGMRHYYYCIGNKNGDRVQKTSTTYHEHHCRCKGRRIRIVLLCVAWYLYLFYRAMCSEPQHSPLHGGGDSFSASTSSILLNGGFIWSKYIAPTVMQGIMVPPPSSETHRQPRSPPQVITQDGNASRWWSIITCQRNINE